MDGEIIGVYVSDSPVAEVKPSFSTYNVRATMADGVVTIFQDVPVATMFGGIGDSLNIVARTAKANGQKLDGTRPLGPQLNASLGDRVIIALMGGHYKRAVIVGYLQHPSQLPKYTERESLEPQATLDYLGMTFSVDELGQLSFIHRGAPDVSYVEQNSLGNLTGSAPDTNPALDPQDDSVITKMEMLDEGGWRIRDSAGNTIWIDPTNQKITLTDVGMPSTDDEEPQTPIDMTLPSKASRELEKTYQVSDGESIVIDGNASSITIYSSDAYKKIIGGDVTNKIEGNTDDTIGGNSDLTISRDYTRTVKGGTTTKTGGDYSETIEGDFDSSITGDFSVSGDSDMAFSSIGDFSTNSDGDTDITTLGNLTLSAAGGVASLKMTEEGMVELTGLSGGLIDLITQLISAITTITVPTAVGPSGPPINAAQMIEIQTLLTQMKA